MTLAIDNLLFLLKSLNVNQLAIVAKGDVRFNEDFRLQCEQNSCGSYNKNWMCPPGVGSIDALKKKVSKFKQGLLFQTVYQLDDSYDYEGMQEGIEKHTKILRQALDYIKSTKVFKEFLPLNIGPCTYCSRCAFLDGLECRFPEEAVSSVEAYGIDVMALVKNCGMFYNNGKNTISCISLIFYSLD